MKNKSQGNDRKLGRGGWKRQDGGTLGKQPKLKLSHTHTQQLVKLLRAPHSTHIPQYQRFIRM